MSVPSSASSTAMAAPIPCCAPVTSAIHPAKEADGSTKLEQPRRGEPAAPSPSPETGLGLADIERQLYLCIAGKGETAVEKDKVWQI